MANIEKSSDDIKCPVFGVCGGCDLQDKSYAEQLRLKQTWVEKALAGFGTKILPIVPSPQSFGYRNRITLHRQGDHIGFYKRASHEVVAVNHCPLATPFVNQKFARTKAVDFGGKTELELREDEAFGFTQVNSGQNENLVKAVVGYASVTKRQAVLELYAGAGNLSFALADVSAKVTAVEGNAQAVELANKIKKERGVKNIRFESGPVHDVVFDLCQKLATFDVVVCDPPREGLRATAKLIARLKPTRIVLVACDLNSLARDAKTLGECGYRLSEAVALDMFPQTRHVEVVGLFHSSPKLSVV